MPSSTDTLRLTDETMEGGVVCASTPVTALRIATMTLIFISLGGPHFIRTLATCEYDFTTRVRDHSLSWPFVLYGFGE